MPTTALLVVIAFVVNQLATNPPQIDLDALPPGAVARLGDARYDGWVYLSPDGKTVAVLPHYSIRGFDHPFINLHDAETGKLLRTLHVPPGDQGHVQSLAVFLSPKRLVGAGFWPPSFGVYLWDTETGRCATRYSIPTRRKRRDARSCPRPVVRRREIADRLQMPGQ